MVKTSLPAKPPTATILAVFDLAPELSVGETLSSPSVTVSVYCGVDPTPSAVISGAATVSGTTVKQLLTGGVLGNVYEVQVTANTSLGQVLVAQAFLAITQGVV